MDTRYANNRNTVHSVALLYEEGLLTFDATQMYMYANELSDRGKRHMEKKNVVFTKDGMKVGVKEVRDEDYADRTQRYVHMFMVLALSNIALKSETGPRLKTVLKLV